MVEILQRLGMQVETTSEGWQATAPTWRFDIAIEQDLVEEVGRIYGYNNIPNQAPVAALNMNLHNEAKLPLKRVRDLLVDRGYQEAITYSFVEPEQQKLVVPGVDALILPNPISAEMSAMRLSLIQGLLNTVFTTKNVSNLVFVCLNTVCASFLMRRQKMACAKSLCWRV